MPAGTQLDLQTLRQAIEGRDTALFKSLYADPAEVYIVDRNSPPSRPRVLRDKGEIAAYLDELGSRDMTHKLEQVVHGGDRIAFLEACEYPDGRRVLCSAVLELEGGKIKRQIGVQAWDEELP